MFYVFYLFFTNIRLSAAAWNAPGCKSFKTQATTLNFCTSVPSEKAPCSTFLIDEFLKSTE